MKKITIEIENINELYSALNNSLICLSQMYQTLSLSCEIPTVWEKWLKKQKEQGRSKEECLAILKNRMDLQKDLMQQLEKYL